MSDDKDIYSSEKERVNETQKVESGVSQSASIVSNNETKDTENQSAQITEANDKYAVNDDLSWGIRIWDVIKNFPYMGCISFGGPAMAITILEKRFVKEKKWVDQGLFKELFALCQGFPGPTQGLMAVCLGTVRAGFIGGVLALILYALPGFIIMTAFGLIAFYFLHATTVPDWMAGLPPAAISLLFLASLKLAKTHVLTAKIKMALALFSSCGTLLVTGDSRVDSRWFALMFPLYLTFGGCVTLIDSKRKGRENLYYKAPDPNLDASLKRKINISIPCGLLTIALWLGVLVAVVLLRNEGLLDDFGKLFESCFRIGSMIFGGGYVVLPMLLQENIVLKNLFFIGFALVQGCPGPLFNFSAFLGAASLGIGGAFLGAIGLFAPGTMFVLGFFPFWTRFRTFKGYKAFISGVSATAIGFVITACIQLWELAVHDAADAVVFLFTGTIVGALNCPVPIAIFFGGLLGFSLSPSAIAIGQSPYCPVTNGTAA